ncbi:lantibiotic dehydratase [Kitasatospora sp. MBT63]|uniref:lantibiotic dehydratase n=1 Tax=Kitasatospora sp. MBT63 TaxID=1444768 RepID=UPI0007C80EEA|nr:lantibiotic dehydratase [Kitasatospora sp. MBT63]
MTAPTADRAPGTQPPRPGADPGEDWALQQQFMLRVAGLPIDAARRLRCTESSRWAAHVIREEDRLAARGAALSDRLHPLIGATEDADARRALIRLRRQLFNSRPAHGHLDIPALHDSRAAGIAEDIAHWAADLTGLADLRARGPAVLAADLDRTRTELRHLAAEPRLRAGLQLASPVLAQQLDAFLDDGPHRPPERRRRKIERSLTAYVYRMACKTSPFSTFTGVAVGDLQPSPADTAAPPVIQIADRWSSHPRLNVVVLARLADSVLADRDRRDDLPVSPAAGWTENDDHIRYVRRRIATGDDTAAVAFDTASDRIFFLRRSGTLHRMLELFRHHPAIRYRELSHWLCRDQQARPEEAERYLGALTELGLVQVPCLAVDVHSTDPARDFQAALRTVDRPWARTLADRLEGPISCVDRYPSAGPAQRGHLLADLRTALQEIQRELGDDTATLPRSLLFEDVRAGPETAAYPLPPAPGQDGGLTGSLYAVERVLRVFDRTIAHRITFKGFFLARYGAGGRCDDLIRLVHEFREDFFEQYLTAADRRTPFDADGAYTPEPNWLHLPGITALDQARQAFTRMLREQWERHGEDEEIRLSTPALTAVADLFRGTGPLLNPRTHFLQPVARTGDPHVVLNQSYGGLAFPFSRFTHCFDAPDARDAPDAPADGDLSARLRRAAAEAGPHGAVLAELTGGFATTNLNLHGRLTDYEIVSTGEVSSAPPEHRIDVEDLHIEHDPASDRLLLRSTRLGREVIPVYFGYLAPQMLPEIPQTLLLLSPTWTIPLDIWAGIPHAPDHDGVTARPRIRCGHIVLSRRTWQTDLTTLPTRGPGTTDATWYLAWQRWRHDHGLPPRVYVRVSTPDTPAGARRRTPHGKPQYVDFDSHLALNALDALLDQPAGQAYFQEALPDEDDLFTRSGRGHHIAELVVQTLTTTAPTRTTGRPEGDR